MPHLLQVMLAIVLMVVAVVCGFQIKGEDSSLLAIIMFGVSYFYYVANRVDRTKEKK